ncbi:MAG: hypothetical protein CVU44_11850 [Chloroflexi bacterium HGW-Chloroflexi-6]|nr:MAG: hypothetical protein CVU44_11850 [Chloroflexi bacterium HGW-Chloroflexi-6]
MNKNAIDNEIRLETRWVAALVIPFLVVAFVILFMFPHETDKLFAWKIQPPMSAMMLGSAYAGGIYFFVGVVRSKQWHKVKVGFLPVITFASLLGIATILHWEKFNHSHVSFFAWVGLYFTTPFIVFFVWLRNRNQNAGYLGDEDRIIPNVARLIMGIFGAVTLTISLFLFLQPSMMISLWPWTLTPLTARVMGAMFALPGVVGLGIASDKRWSAAILILQSQGFSILLILIASIRASEDYNWANWVSWAFVGGLGLMLISIVVVSMFMRNRNENHSS